MGIAVEPATTDLFTVDASGGYVIKDGPPASPAYPAWGTHQYSSATTQTAALADYGVCTIMRGGNQIGSGVFINSDGADDRATGLDPVIVIKLFSTTARLLILTLCLVLV
jgi:hypothetical protein